jgi:hypothetical protein
MIDINSSRLLGGLAGFIAGAAMLAGTASAADSAPAKKATLPGVTSDYRITKPAPLPEPDDAAPGVDNGRFKVGDVDVRISGSITIDVGVGAIQPPRR